MRLLFKGGDYSREASNRRNTVTSQLVPIFKNILISMFQVVQDMTGAVGEGGPAYQDDTQGGMLQPRWRTGSPWLLDRCDEAGREEQSSPTFNLP